jgi:hypothetical protein
VKKFGIAMALLTGCLGSVPLSAAEPVFSCDFGEKSVSISATDDALSYVFGPAGNPELDLTIRLSSSSLSHHFALYAHASERWLRLRTGEHSYVAFELFSTPNYDGRGGYDVSGILVLKGEEQVARLDCDDPVQFGDSFDLSVLPEAGEALSDLIYAAVPPQDNDTISEYGLLSNIEAGPYPFFTVTIEFPERDFSEDFTLNIEAVELDVPGLMALLGYYVSFEYISEFEHGLIDIKSGETMLLGTDISDIDPDWLSVTGILRGAEAVTQSDLPGEVLIESPDGTLTVFPYYVPPQFVRANGKTVTAFYVEMPRIEITRIEASKD